MTRAGRLLAELKRRRVLRVVIAYAVAAWVAIQISETTFPYLGLPDWTITLTIVLAAVGAPLAVVLAWVLDITPAGIEVTPDREDATAVPVRGEGAPRHSDPTPLPVPATPILGRDTELARLAQLFETGARLLTLTGPGGAGKTRLALEAAHQFAPEMRGGAAWVPLSAIRDPALVPSEIGSAFGIGESTDQDVLAAVAASLHDAELLLVLDNFEQVTGAAPVISALLESCPNLRVLVTSRAALRLRGERELPLGPLPTPEPTLSTEELRASAAVKLFAETARRVDPTFVLTEENLPDVATICHRLDGLPLAIELAASRTRALSPRALCDRLASRLSLKADLRDQPAHQRTLRETIEWSHDLLDDRERMLFRRMSVFAEGGGLEAIEAVAGGGLPEEVVDVLDRLMGQSLVTTVRTSRSGREETRFVMLEVIREFATERLVGSGEADEVRKRHASYYADLVEGAERELVGSRLAAWLDRLETEQENIRAALDWLKCEDPISALRLAVGLRRFWEIRGHLSEGRRRLGELLESPLPDSDEARKWHLKGLYAAGVLADAQGDYEEARNRFEACLHINRASNDRWGEANALNNLGVVALRHGDFEAAQSLYTESVDRWRELGNKAAVALALDNLGSAARLSGDLDAARDALAESLVLHEAAGDSNGCALTLAIQSEVARDAGELGEAEGLLEHSLELFRRVENGPEIARSLLELASIRSQRNDPAGAIESTVEAMKTFEALRSPRGLADSLEQLSVLAREAGAEERSSRFAAAARELRTLGLDYDVREALAQANDFAEVSASA